jgi:hemoglobin/transferrin/lactoferrin receptor protein
MKKFFIFFALVSFVCADINGQNARIISTYDKSPVSNAKISRLHNSSSEAQFITNEKGETPLPDSWREDTLLVQAAGYKNTLVLPDQWFGKKLLVELVLSGIIISAVEIPGTRLNTSVENLPLDVIKIRLPAENNPGNMADAIEQSGEVFVQRSQLGGGSPVLRGMEANRILLVIDGVRLNTPIFRGGHLQNIMRHDPNITQEIEVINGSSSPIYGSDALGGVISVNTMKPEFAENGKAVNHRFGGMSRIASGNFKYWNQEKSLHAWHNVGFKRLAIRTSFTFNNFGDLRQGEAGLRKEWERNKHTSVIAGIDTALVNSDPALQIGSAYSQFSANQRWLFSPEKGPQHQLNLQYTKSSDVNRYDRLSESTSNGLPVFAQWFYGPEERALVSYQLKFMRKTSMYDEAVIIAAWQLNRESRNSRRFGNNQLFRRNEQVLSYSINTDLHKKLYNSDLFYGLEAYSHQVASDAFSENIFSKEKSIASTRYPAGGSEVNNASAYITYQRVLLPEKLVSTVGARYTFNHLLADFGQSEIYPFPFSGAQQKNSVICAQAGLTFRMNKKMNWRANWSQGFRSANVDDLAKVFDSQPGSLIVPNPDLKPERTDAFDLGLVFKPVKSLKLEFGAYYTVLHGAIVTRPFKLGSADSLLYDGEYSAILANVNASKAEISGLNAKISWQSKGGTSMNASAAYTKGIVYNDGVSAPLDHIPPIFGKFQLNQKIKKRLSVSTWLMFQGEKPLSLYSPSGEDNLQYATSSGMPAWHTINLRAGVEVSESVKLDLSAENLLDTNYRVFASGISATGRLIKLSLQVSFN